MEANLYLPPPYSITGCNYYTKNCPPHLVRGSLWQNLPSEFAVPNPVIKTRVTSVAGFTLIELSIVLVIIGLIIGGVMVGRDLIMSAKLRSVLTDVEKFNSAALTFKVKYNCIPGDCPNATDFLGQFASCSSDIENIGYNMGAKTCNGSGNGRLIVWTSAPTNYWQFDETVLFWNHLFLAGLINGNYSGVFQWGIEMKPGVNVPLSSFERGCYSINSSLTGGDSNYLPYTSMKGNFLSLGDSIAGEGGHYMQTCTESLASLPAIFAQNIDRKIDDGKPLIGNVQTTVDRYNGNLNSAYYGDPASPPGCTNLGGGVGVSTTIYATSAATSGCQLFFKASF